MRNPDMQIATVDLCWDCRNLMSQGYRLEKLGPTNAGEGTKTKTVCDQCHRRCYGLIQYNVYSKREE